MRQRVGILILTLGLVPVRGQVTNPLSIRSTVFMLPATYAGETYNAVQFEPRADGLLRLWPRNATEGGGGGTNVAGITNLNGITNASQTLATGTTGTDFGISSSGSTHTFHLPTASSTTRGALASADWSAFNAKQGAITVQTNGVLLASFPTTWNFGPGLTGHVSGATVVLGNSVAGGGDVTTAQLLYVSNQVQTASNKFQTDIGDLQAVTNLISTKQHGNTHLTNLAGNPYVQYTNIGAFQATNTTLTDLAGLAATNKLVFTNDAWLDRVASNRVEVAAGAGISVASANSGNKQVFTVTATGGGGGGGAGSLPMNLNQFDTNTTASIKNGARVTNLFVHEFLTLTNGSSPGVPTTNNLVLGKDSYAGRGILESWDDNGLSIAYQPAFFNNRITMFQPSATTVIGTYGITTPVNLGGVTVSHPPPTEQWPYMVQLATPGTSNACAGTFSSIDMTTMGTRYGHSGYFLATEFMTTNRLNQHTLTAPAGNRLFIGRTSTASPNLTNIVNTTNGTGQYAGLYVDSGHTNQFFLTARDGTAEFRTNTGLFYVATNLYQFYMMQAPTSRMLAWKLKDMTSNTVAQGWFSNNVPTNMMKFGYLIRNGTTVVNSVRFSKLYVEAPLSP